MTSCLMCNDCGWVCESHPYVSWGETWSCKCGAPGKPCECNPNDEIYNAPFGADEHIPLT